VNPAAEALRLLERSGATLGVAESLTGGLLAAELTAVPGASRAFRGSVTAYATELKRDVLGVGAALLAECGAVDPLVAEAMAQGARGVLGAVWGLATTGVAGPAPQDGKPVGTAYVAVAGPGRTRVESLRLEGDRAAIREATVRSALGLLIDVLKTAPEVTQGTHGVNAGGQDTEHDWGF
jgi:nicotinamide-nucleotide amidase